MKMMRYAEKDGAGKDDYCIQWLADGKSFIIKVSLVKCRATS